MKPLVNELYYKNHKRDILLKYIKNELKKYL
jgi:hypothetical protein